MAETTHSYLDWQISTLLLAHDAASPLSRDDVERLTAREKSVHLEIHELALATIPQSYRENPESDFPAEIVVLLTRATLARAAQIIGILPT